MNHYLIVCRSVTQAQRAGYLLSAAGITNRIFRSPVGLTERGCSYSVRIGEPYLARAMEILRLGLTERGCSYSVRIGEPYLARAMEILRQNSLQPVKLFLHRDGQYFEVALS